METITSSPTGRKTAVIRTCSQVNVILLFTCIQTVLLFPLCFLDGSDAVSCTCLVPDVHSRHEGCQGGFV